MIQAQGLLEAHRGAEDDGLAPELARRPKLFLPPCTSGIPHCPRELGNPQGCYPATRHAEHVPHAASFPQFPVFHKLGAGDGEAEALDLDCLGNREGTVGAAVGSAGTDASPGRHPRLRSVAMAPSLVREGREMGEHTG